jgi:hypothetical protein
LSGALVLQTLQHCLAKMQEGIDVETKTKKDYFQRLDDAAQAGGVCRKGMKRNEF